ncbi:MAG: STAS/SEC14 domain-containing protein [Comamonadaceae bacterium]|nr:STAS/SEC14 domain-containing protein [Comamonadaceae bacterium]
MITTKETGDLLEAHIYNEFVLADYREFEQAVGRELRKALKIRLLLDFTSMIDYTIDVAWEEIKFTRAHAHDFKRIAVVTPGEWAPWRMGQRRLHRRRGAHLRGREHRPRLAQRAHQVDRVRGRAARYPVPIPAKAHRPVAAMLLAATLLAAGCAPGRARAPVAAPVPEVVVTPVPLPPTPVPEALAPPVVEALVAAVRARLAMPVSACGATVLDSRELAPFYPADEPALLWLSANGATVRARALRAALQAAGDEGLGAARYPLADIDWYGVGRLGRGSRPCLELLLTDAFPALQPRPARGASIRGQVLLDCL